MNTWSAARVADWLKSAGFEEFTKYFKGTKIINCIDLNLENDITGDILIHADHDLLRELDIESVGTRIAILKAIYHEKIKNGIPLDIDDYVPESNNIIYLLNLSCYCQAWISK